MGFKLHFSERGTFPAASQDYALLRARWLAHERPIHLSGSSPSKAGLALPPFAEILGRTSPENYSPDPKGLLTARAAISGTLKERAQIPSEDVFITASTSEAYSFLLGALCDPGDGVLVPTPSYPLFEQITQLAQVKLYPYRCRYDGAWHLDPGSLPDQQTIMDKRIRLVLCVSPNNPTGHSLIESDFDALFRLGLPVVCDEVFRAYSLRKHNASPHTQAEKSYDPLTRSDLPVPLLLLDGLSKRLCAPGLKLGWIVGRGPGSAEILAHLQWYADTFLSVGSAVQQALPELFEQEPEVQSRVLARLGEDVLVIKEMCKGSSLTPLYPNAGWSLILRLPSVLSEMDAWSAAAQNGVWIEPGHFYDLPFESSFVLSLLTPPQELREGLTRLTSIFRD